MKKTCILIVDDEPSIVKFMRANLTAEGYNVLTAMDGARALQVFEMELPDLVILDIMMPKMDGFEVCHRLREWSQVPIIMLSARSDESDKVKCFDLGADDYVTKPFGKNEILARVKAVLRRSETPAVCSPTLRLNDLIIDFASRRVTLGGQDVDLTGTEYTLLSYLAQNAGLVVTPSQILEKVWGEEYLGENHLLHVNIGRLRRKLKDDSKDAKIIITKTGIGYMFFRPGKSQ